MTLPVEVNPLLQAPASTAYTINNSLRFRSSASAYLSRTYSNASTLRTKQTFSFWTKRGTLGSRVHLTSTYDGSSGASTDLYFNASDQLEFDFGGTAVFANITNAVFRDPSSWYHIVLSIDTTQATSTSRIILYVNGVQQSLGTANVPAQNTSCVFPQLNSNNKIGTNYNNSSVFFDGYLAEYNFIDGQALTPSSFGAYNSIGVWQPARYTGTYGTNGFYLKFASFGTAAALGTDSSGNGNTWTVNNFSVTAGTTYDPMLDSPTLTSATVANYCVMNPVGSKFNTTDVLATFSNGNLQTNGGAGTANVNGTLGSTSGKFYFECYCNVSSASGNIIVGLNTVTSGYNMTVGVRNNGTNAGLTITSGAAFSYTTGDMVGVAFDLSSTSCIFYKNGVQQLTGTYGVTQSVTAWAQMNGATDSLIWNFGQRPFTYTPPSGYVALNAYNLPTPTIPNGATVMAATTYTGNGSTQNISNASNNNIGTTFQPDFVWMKQRNSASPHNLSNSITGASYFLFSNTTSAEVGNSNIISAYTSTGFTVGTDIYANQNGSTYVGWQWKAGAGSSSSNTSGSITSTVSVNATAGFSVVTYTGTGANATVGHGLGAVPSMVIVKNRISTTQNWNVWFSGFAGTDYILLNTTAAIGSSTTVWNSTAPSSTVFSVGTANGTNGSTNGMVAYCWSAVAGYSAFGSYTGNGSADGPFVYTGFRPRWVMIKRSTGVANWFICDTSRDTYNVAQNRLFPSLSNAEVNSPVEYDILSNGFKIRVDGATDGGTNNSGDTYIYAAFAENPFKYALAR